MPNDPEKDAINVAYVKGYPSLAALIASDFGHSSVIYKRFDRLSARNALYLQSELAELEQQLDEYDREDLYDDDPASNATRIARDWKALRDAVGRGEPKATARMDLIKDIREKLKEYKEAIMLDSALLTLSRPSRQAHKAFRNEFMNVSRTENAFPTLARSSASLYDHRDDLIALVRPREEDRLTAFLRKHCSRLFLTGRPNPQSGVQYFSARRIACFVTVVNVLLAAALLFGAIYTLCYVDSDQVKLGLIAGFTMAFALCVSLITNARRGEVFGACAAYAAVLVVFVSGSLNGAGLNNDTKPS